MNLESDFSVMADIGFPKTAERIREEMRRQNQAVRYTNDLYEQMDAERKRQDAELERLRSALSDVLEHIEGNIEVCVRDIINGLASANDIYDDCEQVKAMIMKALGDTDE